MKVKALKRHGYAGVTRNQGTVYFIDNPAHVKLLVATKTVKLVPETATKTESKAKVAKVKRDEEKVEKKTKTKVKKSKSHYSRKDLTAENVNVDTKQETTVKERSEDEKTTDED
jgi:hypothetical protein